MKNLSVKFKQKNLHGWIRLFINSQGKKHKVSISYVFPPFNDFINFLENVLKRKNSKFSIDEEGRLTEFVAQKFDKKGNFHFILRDELKPHYIYINGTYNTNDFILEFLNKFKYFLDNNFDEKRWNLKEKMPYNKVNKILRLLKLKSKKDLIKIRKI